MRADLFEELEVMGRDDEVQGALPSTRRLDRVDADSLARPSMNRLRVFRPAALGNQRSAHDNRRRRYGRGKAIGGPRRGRVRDHIGAHEGGTKYEGLEH